MVIKCIFMSAPRGMRHLQIQDKSMLTTSLTQPYVSVSNGFDFQRSRFSHQKLCVNLAPWPSPASAGDDDSKPVMGQKFYSKNPPAYQLKYHTATIASSATAISMYKESIPHHWGLDAA